MANRKINTIVDCRIIRLKCIMKFNEEYNNIVGLFNLFIISASAVFGEIVGCCGAI